MTKSPSTTSPINFPELLITLPSDKARPIFIFKTSIIEPSGMTDPIIFPVKSITVPRFNKLRFLSVEPPGRIAVTLLPFKSMTSPSELV